VYNLACCVDSRSELWNWLPVSWDTNQKPAYNCSEQQPVLSCPIEV